MCGISFYCSTSGRKEDELLDSLIATEHRGPDAKGFYNDFIGEYDIGLGHNRLSIIDLSDAGSQPMHSETGFSIVFNGEIYNYKKLRDELIVKGYVFESETDTEVILKLYEERGIKAFDSLVGMFAFTLLDKKKGELFVVRDVVGIKPVYLYSDENELYGCSEIKGLRKFKEVSTELCQHQLFEFFNNGFLYEPNTGYKNIYKLLPGHYLKLNLTTRKKSVVQYSTINDFNNTKDLEKKVKKAVENQLMSDVPLGVFFSGGADSSVLAAYAKNNDLLFAKYETDVNSDIDSEYAKKISAYLEKELVVTDLSANQNSTDEILQTIDFVAQHTEELISDYTFWATYSLSNSARNNGYKVMLSGMGGDEAFAGYPRYTVLKYHSIIKMISPLLKFALKLKLFPKKLDKKFERLVSYANEKNWAIAYSRLIGYFSDTELTSFFKDSKELKNQLENKYVSLLSEYAGNKNDKIKLAQFLDLKGFLAHNLTVSDKASMMASIELRVPFLDEGVLAHGLALNSNKLVESGVLKAPLKNLLKKCLPNSLIERPKTGFNPPLDGIINRIGEVKILEELQTTSSIINLEPVRDIVLEHFSGKKNNTYKIWQLLYFAKWMKYHA